MADVRQQLKERGIHVPKYASKKRMRNQLAEVLTKEEDLEAHALAQACSALQGSDGRLLIIRCDCTLEAELSPGSPCRPWTAAKNEK